MTLAKLKTLRKELEQLDLDIGSEQEHWESKKVELYKIKDLSKEVGRKLEDVLQK